MKGSKEKFFKLIGGDKARPFVIKITDPEKIKEAEKYLVDGSAGQYKVKGKVIKKGVSYNPLWPFFIDPRDISFETALQPETDMTPEAIENNISTEGSTSLPGRVWTPSSLTMTESIDVNFGIPVQIKITGKKLEITEAKIVKINALGREIGKSIELKFENNQSFPVNLKIGRYKVKFKLNIYKTGSCNVSILSESNRLRASTNPETFPIQFQGIFENEKYFVIV